MLKKGPRQSVLTAVVFEGIGRIFVEIGGVFNKTLGTKILEMPIRGATKMKTPGAFQILAEKTKIEILNHRRKILINPLVPGTVNLRTLQSDRPSQILIILGLGRGQIKILKMILGIIIKAGTILKNLAVRKKSSGHE